MLEKDEVAQKRIPPKTIAAEQWSASCWVRLHGRRDPGIRMRPKHMLSV